MKNEHNKEPDKAKFDLASLKLSQDFGAEVGVKKLITTIPIRKPNKHEFVRVHAGPAYQLQTAVIEIKEDRETYFVDQAIAIQLPDMVVPKLIVVAINRQGVVFLWPIRLPGPDGRHDNWNSSALEASISDRSNSSASTSVSQYSRSTFCSSALQGPPRSANSRISFLFSAVMAGR